MALNKKLSDAARTALLETLEKRFTKHQQRHKGIVWGKVLEALQGNAKGLWTLQQMEDTGGEPDVVGFDKKTGEFVFFDCSAETPKERRSICYDDEALIARKENKPRDSAMNMASEMGITMLDEEQYRMLQTLGEFDLKTSSWLATPAPIRKLGGAIFGDRRFNTVFVYHNGAESYYAARGFRGCVRV